jgi:hypothetical protein
MRPEATFKPAPESHAGTVSVLFKSHAYAPPLSPGLVRPDVCGCGRNREGLPGLWQQTRMRPTGLGNVLRHGRRRTGLRAIV